MYFMKMSHEEYIEKKRKRAAKGTSSMLDGSIHYLEDEMELSTLNLSSAYLKTIKLF
jgi:hypothetical protein